MKSIPVAKKIIESAEAILQRAGAGSNPPFPSAIALAYDVVFVLDRLGQLVDLTILNEDSVSKPFVDRAMVLIGKPFVDLVSSESRLKAIEIMRSAALDGISRPRELNIQFGSESLALSVAAVRLDHEARVLLLCRDLRMVSRLQGQLVEAQQRVEREYSRQRALETRVQAMMQLVSEGVVLIEESSLRIAELNAMASDLLGESPKGRTGGREKVGRPLSEFFDSSSKTALLAWLARISREPYAGHFEGVLKHDSKAIQVRATLIRQQEGPAYLLTLKVLNEQTAASSLEPRNGVLAAMFEGLPDALVVAEAEGRIVFANQAFADLVQMARVDQVQGAFLTRWFSRSEVDLSLLVATLKQHEVVREYTTDIRGEYGAVRAVSIAGVVRVVAGQSCYCFAIRDVERQGRAAKASNDRFISRSSEELRELVGRVPLKDIVAETADLIERLCIESALDLTSDNRAAAAEMLGLSRQSLYVKLRRYGVGYDENGSLIGDDAS